MFDRSIKPMLKQIVSSLTGKWTEIRIEYGILALVASIAVPLKLLLFYQLIGISANFFLVWLITAVLTWFLFASFKNKWIPAVIYLLLSVLMFSDVTYSSFFNRYLSVNMLGAADVLNDITASIKDVIKPWFFLILADSVLALAALTVRQYRKYKSKPIEETATVEVVVETPVAEPAEKTIAAIIIAWVSSRKKPVIGILIVCLLVFNFSGSYLVTSLSNQEIYSFHVKDIVNKLTGNTMAGQENEYMSSVPSSYAMEKDGPLFGVAKGRNLIVIQIESLQNLVINKKYNGQEITPNLNKIIQDNTVYFDRYYQQIGSGNTSDAEFATNNSIYGTLSSYTYKLYAGNYFKGLPKLLKEKGYNTAVFHAYEDRNFWNRQNMYPAEGFDTFYGGIGGKDKGQYDMTDWMGWGLTDTEFFKQTVPYLKGLAQPFYSFIITLSNHFPYEMLDKYKFIDLLPEDEGTTFGNYLNSAAYTDYAIGQLVQQLKDEGLYDNSIIAFYGDHMGLPKTDEEIYKSVSRFLGKDYDFDTMMNIPLIITVPGADQDIRQTVSTTGGQLDFLPTIAYLMGFDSLDTVYLGHNLMTIDSGFVAEQTYMTKGSFFSDDIDYEMSRDGVFENGRAWNPKTGKPVPVKDAYDGYVRSTRLINTSEYILKNDALREVYEENQSTASSIEARQ